jgi:signal transduction histidine kinase
MVTTLDLPVDALVAHAVIDRDGRLVRADAALAGLNERAGGVPGLPLAVPQLAAAVWLAQRLGIPVSRRLTVADNEADVDLSIVAEPDGDHVRLAASGWTMRPAWRPAPAMMPPCRPDDGLAWETDAALRLTFLASEAGPVQGVDPVAMLGRPLTALFRFDDGAAPILDALAGRRRKVEQAAVNRVTGRAMILSATLRTDPMGGAAGLVGTARLAPAEPLGEDVLATAFTAGLDRALRTSLTRIVGEADAIGVQDDGPIATDYADYAGDIASAGRHLMGLVDDLVDLQAIERPDFVPAAGPIDLADLGRRAAGLLAVRADHAGVTIDRPAAEARAPCTGDARRVLQILVNLIGNALRYSPAGASIAIDTASSAGMARLTVADQGKGIAAADHARIFMKFGRVDPGEAGGNGLGLFIARRLATAMGGDLTVDSAPAEGARFTLTLPARQAPRDQQ